MMKLERKNIGLLLFILTFWSHAQDLTIINGELVTITNNTNFFVNGLAFLPSSDFTLNAPNAISRTSSAIDPQSINRVFTSDNIMSGFQGTLTFFYEDTELNGVTENDLVLQVKDGTDIWNAYNGTLDTNANSLAFTFGVSSDFSSVTASASGITLDIFDFDKFDLKLYPNPTISKVYIKASFDYKVNVYNLIGQKVLTSSEKYIDLSQLNSGSYIFKIQDLSTNNTKAFKIIKN